MSEYWNQDPEERIVITGMGCVSPMGNNVEEAMDRVFEGRHAFTNLPEEYWNTHRRVNAKTYAPVVGFEDDFNSDEALARVVNPKYRRRLDLSAQYSLYAARQATIQAGLVTSDVLRLDEAGIVDPKRVAISIGTGIGGTEGAIDFYKQLMDNDPRIFPSSILDALPERVASVPGLILGAKGRLREVTGACATGNLNLGQAYDLLRSKRRNKPEIVIAGGVDARVPFVRIGYFGLLGALDTGEDPELVSRPYDKERDGFVMAEGAGVFVVESLANALRRGVTPIAEFVGYGETSDGEHDTSSNGVDASRAIREALEEFDIDTLENIYVNAHATGTGNDGTEARLAIGGALRPDQLAGVSATKSIHGHMLGGAGAFESMISIAALLRQQIPPTLKLVNPIEEISGYFVPGVASDRQIDVAVNNSFGFGGFNAVTAFAKVR